MNHSQEYCSWHNQSSSHATHDVHNLLTPWNTPYSSVTHPLDAGATSFMYWNKRRRKTHIQYRANDYYICHNRTDNAQDKSTFQRAPQVALYDGGLHFLRLSSSCASVRSTSMALLTTSIVIKSPFWTRPIGPPSWKIAPLWTTNTFCC